MKNKELRANIIFFIGVAVFLGALCFGFIDKSFNKLILSGIMAFGLLIEFVGLILIFRADKKKTPKTGKTEEEIELEKEKSVNEEKVENIVEATTKPVKEEKVEKAEEQPKKNTTTTKKKTTTNKSSAKKNTTKKTSTAKKTTNKKKTTTKKSNNKKSK